MASEPLKDLGTKSLDKGGNFTFHPPALPSVALSLLTISSPPGSPDWASGYSPKTSLELIHGESPILSSEEGDSKNFSDILLEDLHERPKTFSSALPEAPNKHSQYLPTSCPTIDNALHGGFSYHIINSLSSEYNTERTLIAMHAITSHLISHPSAQATWVDTEGSFSATYLKSVVSSRVDRLGIAVESVLDRVQVERVIEIQGLIEILNELKGKKCEKPEGGTELEKEMEERISHGQGYTFKEDRNQEAKERIINDSQGDDEDWEDEEGQAGKKEEDEKKKVNDSGRGSNIRVVVVDTITHLLSEMKFIDPGDPEGIEKDPFEMEDEWHEIDKSEVTALFVDFCHSFLLIAKEQKICLLLLNDTTPTPDNIDCYVRSHELPPSQFYKVPEIKPSLGPVYTEYIDFSALLTKQPCDYIIVPDRSGLDFDDPNFTAPEGIKSPQNAKQLKGVIEAIHGSGYSDEWVIEVMGDRYGERGGAWGAFRVEGVELIEIII